METEARQPACSPSALTLIDTGNALEDQGLIQEALSEYRNAVRVDPGCARAHLNCGNAHLSLNQVSEARAAFEIALQHDPRYAAAHYNLGNTYARMDDYSAALACYQKALEFRADFADAEVAAALAEEHLGHFDGAVARYRRALTINPLYAEVHFNLGCTLRTLGLYELAETHLRRALELKPAFRDSESALIDTLVAAGDLDEALLQTEISLSIGETAHARRAFVFCVSRIRSPHVDAAYRERLTKAIAQAWGSHAELGGAATATLLANEQVARPVRRAIESWPVRLNQQSLFLGAELEVMAADPLFQVLLDSAPVSTFDLERFLTSARSAMLSRALATSTTQPASDAELSFCASLAQQCFINEYLFAYEEKEAERAGNLRDALLAALDVGTPIVPLWLLVVAAYFPLNSLPGAARLLERAWPRGAAAVVTQQIREPLEEEALAPTIKRLTPMEDEVSQRVRAMYEENPYPRWVKMTTDDNPLTISDFLHRSFPFARPLPHGGDSAPEMLVAGCGTGSHPIASAARFRNVSVLAVDLSLRSLSYAKRKTQERGVTNISYGQADILNLETLGRQFDIVESVGVLHHLGDPAAGLAVLVRILRPGGLIRLGFYSELARKRITKTREFAAERGYAGTLDDIRKLRQDIIAADPDSGLLLGAQTIDFFSASTCRDLVFNVQEHRLTIEQIEAMLAENNLNFLGFDTTADVFHAYRRRFPDDMAGVNLKNWRVFETENPATFYGMYQFWSQKSPGMN